MNRHAFLKSRPKAPATPDAPKMQPVSVSATKTMDPPVSTPGGRHAFVAMGSPRSIGSPCARRCRVLRCLQSDLSHLNGEVCKRCRLIWNRNLMRRPGLVCHSVAFAILQSHLLQGFLSGTSHALRQGHIDPAAGDGLYGYRGDRPPICHLHGREACASCQPRHPQRDDAAAL